MEKKCGEKVGRKEENMNILEELCIYKPDTVKSY